MATRRYAALLRGVSPMNARMPELKSCFEAAGFTDVKTVLASGNVVFSADAASEAALERKAEAAMTARLGRTFATIVRSLDALRALLDADPYASFRLAPGSKRVVTFLRGAPTATLPLPVELDGARILCRKGSEVFTAYVPSPRGAVFMTLIEKTFGPEVTTRTWDSVKKIVGDHPPAPIAGRSTPPAASPGASPAKRPAASPAKRPAASPAKRPAASPARPRRRR
jgi:uncharacterized protein (DUF1697 family)